jgi:hypothetical protein
MSGAEITPEQVQDALDRVLSTIWSVRWGDQKQRIDLLADALEEMTMVVASLAKQVHSQSN